VDEHGGPYISEGCTTKKKSQLKLRGSKDKVTLLILG
jgi:hypothetical protein